MSLCHRCMMNIAYELITLSEQGISSEELWGVVGLM